MAHLQAEDERRLLLPHRCVRGNVERERRLSHRRTRPDDDQGARLQTGKEFVEVDEAGRCAGDALACLIELFESVERFVEQIVDLAHRVGNASLRHLEHHVLGLVDRPENVLRAGVAEIGDLVRRFDQTPQQVSLGDDLGVLAGVRCRWGVDLKTDQSVEPADHLEHAHAFEFRSNGDRISRIAACVQARNRIEHMGIRRPIEVDRLGVLNGVRNGVARQQHGAEQGFLGLQIVGRDTLSG